MKTEQEVIERIKYFIQDNKCFLDMEDAIDEDATIAYIQKDCLAILSQLYWVIEKDRPKFKCEE